MRWLADECVAAAVVARLRAEGHDVLYFAEVDAGAIDSDVIRRAASEHRLLLTEDKDFGELVFRRMQPVPGLVLLRLGKEDSVLKGNRLLAAIAEFGDQLFGRYTVVEMARFRARRLFS